MNKQLGYSVVGTGFWGKILIKTLKNLDFNIVKTCDSVAVENFVDNQIPHVTNYQDILADENINVICITTPPTSHFELAKKAIEAKKHIWVEKPFCATYKESCELLNLARENKVNIHVDLTWLYNADFNLIQDLKTLGRFGKEKFAKFNWQSFGKFQDIGNIKDLAVHPLSLAVKLWGQPDYISAHGYFNNKINEAAEIVLSYNRGLEYFKVYISSNWWSPKKIRNLLITTSDGVLETDFTGQVDFINFKGEKQILKSTNLGSPLEVEFIHLQNRWNDNKTTWSDGNFGAILMNLLEKIEKSCLNSGREENV